MLLGYAAGSQQLLVARIAPRGSRLFCSQCGTPPSGPQSRFCAVCGTAFPPSPAPSTAPAPSTRAYPDTVAAGSGAGPTMAWPVPAAGPTTVGLAMAIALGLVVLAVGFVAGYLIITSYASR